MKNTRLKHFVPQYPQLSDDLKQSPETSRRSGQVAAVAKPLLASMDARVFRPIYSYDR